MLHFKTIVSRKTPLDGRLEISESLAIRLSDAAAPLALLLNGEESPVHVEAMPCTCGKGAAGNHTHHFLASESLRSLTAGVTVNIEVDPEAGVISLAVDG